MKQAKGKVYVHVEAANRDDDDLDQYDSLIPEGK